MKDFNQNFDDETTLEKNIELLESVRVNNICDILNFLIEESKGDPDKEKILSDIANEFYDISKNFDDLVNFFDKNE